MNAAPDIDVVVPVHDEAAALERSVRRLHAFLRDGFPFSWRIVVADNASTDGTLEIARRLAAELDGVDVLRLERKGRGRALRAAWSASPARVVAYMDVDLSTDLRGLLPLVAPLLSGHSDLAIGTRLAHGSRVVRGPRRDVISRGDNAILHAALRTRFSDAQCGFKAMRAELVGVARLAAAGPVARFAAVGVASTLAYALLFLLARGPAGAALANVFALAVTAVGNTAANRRFTFRVRGRAGLVRHHVLGSVVFVLTVGLTSGALVVLHGLVVRPSRALELAVLIAASAAATVTRYVALRSWVFVHRRRGGIVLNPIEETRR